MGLAVGIEKLAGVGLLGGGGRAKKSSTCGVHILERSAA